MFVCQWSHESRSLCSNIRRNSQIGWHMHVRILSMHKGTWDEVCIVQPIHVCQGICTCAHIIKVCTRWNCTCTKQCAHVHHPCMPFSTVPNNCLSFHNALRTEGLARNMVMHKKWAVLKDTTLTLFWWISRHYQDHLTWSHFSLSMMMHLK